MVKVIVSHEVKDFATWKKAFDESSADRDQSGMNATAYTATDNPNHVTVIGEFPNEEAVHGFMNSPELKETMEKAGVVGKPDIRILKEA
ncbi:MAG: hypothetical protein JWN78_1033 [Bacteroidota bacterium]|nr:hypothetical protein [Bacteroidota bacterium]